MISKSFLIKVVIFLVLITNSLSWRRRRRRRLPPPPRDCQVSTWSSWSSCSKNCDIGTRPRYRSIVSDAAFGGRGCGAYPLQQSQACGANNGGCSHFCKNGKCSCPPGYKLIVGDQKVCGDIDECSEGTSTCVNSKCKNNLGGYTCECLPGFEKMTNYQCSPRSCGSLTFQQCPAGAYRDVFGTTCSQVQANCLDGLSLLDKCTLTCPMNYKLAIIAPPSQAKQFAETFSEIDFISAHYIFTCSLDASAHSVSWDWLSEKDSYYCRRVNDPPMSITISNSSLIERAPFLTVVGEFMANDPQEDNLVFTIENHEGNNNFLIQNNKLLVKTVLMWRPSEMNSYLVVLNATDSGSPPMHSQTRFNITILNVNDPPYTIQLSNNEISENVPVDEILGNLSAIDDDLGPHRSSNFSWELVDSDDGFFSVLGNQVMVAKTLNHEQRAVHKIQVRCSDYGKPRQTSAIATLVVNVINENDSPKSIILSHTNVKENSNLDTVVGEVMATDEDNDTLSFDLNGTNPKVLEKFKLMGPTVCKIKTDSTTGKAEQTCAINLVVNGGLDYEERDEYVIWISVADPGGITREKFNIKIEDVNERPTGIILTRNHIPENSHGGTAVGKFVVSDPDKTKETHTCHLENSDTGDEDAFLVSRKHNINLLQVKANKDLNFEKKDVYKLHVTCKDSELSLTKSFSILITDVNEKPTSLHLSSNKLQENAADLTFIGNLSTEDPEGNNQDFLYTVTSYSFGNFFIGGAAKNQLLVNGSIDFEKIPNINVYIRVTDPGGLYLENMFIINVEDVNDPPTAIILQPNHFPENSAQRVLIGTLTIEDEDSNSKPSCQLLNASNDRVVLDKLNLVVGPRMTDYESLDSDFLEILVKCSDDYGASITQWLTVKVEDINEPPTELKLLNSYIPENQNNSLVGILRIIDPDVNQHYNCHILTAQNVSTFYIDANSLALMTAKPLNFESSRYHYVDIICEDSEGEMIKKEFIIHVRDVNERPIFHCNSSFYVLANSSNATVVGQIEGYDPDNEAYYISKNSNPKGPYQLRKQQLHYRSEPENNSWPFDISFDGVIYVEGHELGEDDYSLGVYVEDDGILSGQGTNGTDEYQIKNDERKTSVRQCQIVVTSNGTDINLSSNYVYENATIGTTIGTLSRKNSSPNETISFKIIHGEDVPFFIDGNKMKVSSGESLDYEALDADKKLVVTVSSHGSKSGVFTKQFVIEIIDVNEKPLAICLSQPQSTDDCAMLGQILIKDPDYPTLQCGSANPVKKQSEYKCHVQSNQMIRTFYIKNLILYANKSVLTHGGNSIVDIFCKSTLESLYTLSTTLAVTVSSSLSSSCCSSCPQPNFCLHVLPRICVGEAYRINSTMDIPVTYFENQDFIAKFQEYVKSLIENKSEGKTLKQLMKEFDDPNKSSSRRRRRDASPPFDDVFVEVLAHDGAKKTTSVVFAVAEKEQARYELISASMACQLLENSDVKCTTQKNTGKSTGSEKKEGFALWIIIVIVGGVLVLVIIVTVVIWRRRITKSKNSASDVVVHFSRNDDAPNFSVPTGSNMYETPVDNGKQQTVTLPHRNKKDNVFNNPMYQTQDNPDSDDEADGKRRTLNQYEKPGPAEPIYEQVDEEFYEFIHDVDGESSRRTRNNPFYNMNEGHDDVLNPVVNMAVSPSKKDYDSPRDHGEMSTFKYDDEQEIMEMSKDGDGIENAIYVSDVDKTTISRIPPPVPQKSKTRARNDVGQRNLHEQHYARPTTQKRKDDSTC